MVHDTGILVQRRPKLPDERVKTVLRLGLAHAVQFGDRTYDHLDFHARKLATPAASRNPTDGAEAPLTAPP